MKLATSLENKVLVLGEAAEQFPLSNYLRKNYQVETSLDGILWNREAAVFNNSTEAQACADANAAKNIQARVVVVEITDTPKKAFWGLWKQFKKQIAAQGVYVTKRGEEFVVTDRKATKGDVLRSKGYGRRDSYEAPAWNKHEMIDRDAERYGW